jgi:hypothetical protein
MADVKIVVQRTAFALPQGATGASIQVLPPGGGYTLMGAPYATISGSVGAYELQAITVWRSDLP